METDRQKTKGNEIELLVFVSFLKGGGRGGGEGLSFQFCFGLMFGVRESKAKRQVYQWTG